MAFKSVLPRRSSTTTTGNTTRTSTTTSLGDDDAIPDSDYKDTTNLLVERLQAWKHVCGSLEDYMTTTMKVQKSHAKELEKIFKTVSEPIKEEHHFDKGASGISGLFEVLRRNTQGLAEAHADAENRLKRSVVPVLERLHTEIKAKAKELGSGAIKHGKEVTKSRGVTQKHIELLGQCTATYETSKTRVEAAHDPYVLSRGVTYRLGRQVADENLHFQEIMTIQNSFPVFETHIIETIQRALNEFYQCMGAQVDHHRNMYSNIVAHSQHIPTDFEWANFFERNDATLLNPNLPPRDLATIKYANQDHHATKPLVEGILDRKSRAVLKGYTGGYYAVTPAGYLHGFKENDDTRHEPTPDISLYLPECTIGGFNDLKFSVKGKDMSGSKVGSAFHMTSEFNFKARTKNDLEQWQAVLSNPAGWSGAGSVASPVKHASPASPASPISPATTTPNLEPAPAPTTVPTTEPVPEKTTVPAPTTEPVPEKTTVPEPVPEKPTTEPLPTTGGTVNPGQEEGVVSVPAEK
ncbi:PH domain-containing protein [Arthroderma uncinatum]|uniref:PH domain-containing protein n=1 Tax=Arthroderma uncinatum TaxID=74035 RepID=UPI00144A5E26|nr:PH domain-containing protein [Arthroderma uncinatum]KAF3484438.1 PH domain-containing protein [Arthroderma uncinatum]